MILHGPVRPPDTAGPGTATLTVSFDAWAGASVAPTTHAVAVARPKGLAVSEPVSPRLVRSLVHTDHKAIVDPVQFSPDGRRLFAAGYPSGVLQFWDVAAGKELLRLDAQPGKRVSFETRPELPADWSAVYVPQERRKLVSGERDGRRTVGYDFDGEVLVFDAATGQPRPTLKPPPGHGVSHVYASPDGRKLVAQEQPSFAPGERKANRVVLWDTRTATAKPLGEGYDATAAFTPDSEQFALCLNNSARQSAVLKLFRADGAELAELATVTGWRLIWPRFSADGRRLAAVQATSGGVQPGALRVWDVAARKELATSPFRGPFPFTGLAIAPDGRRLAAMDYKGGVWVWDVATGKAVVEKSFGDAVTFWHLALAPDGRRLAVLGQPAWDRKQFVGQPDPLDLPQPRVFLFDLTAAATEPEVVICPHGYQLGPTGGGLAFSPDGRMLAVGGTGAVHLFDMADPPGQKR
ncbi:MAG: WD40 repeat domain-containing protein [Gemmataceae bacterium]